MRPVRATSTILPSDFLGPRVVDPQRDLDLRQERLRVFRVGVVVEIGLLLADAFDFATLTASKGAPAQRVENLLDQKRLHDGDDLFHEWTLNHRLSVIS